MTIETRLRCSSCGESIGACVGFVDKINKKENNPAVFYVPVLVSPEVEFFRCLSGACGKIHQNLLSTQGVMRDVMDKVFLQMDNA